MYILIMKTSAKIILIVVIVAVALGVWWWVAYQQNGNTSGAGSYAPIATTPTTTPTPVATTTQNGPVVLNTSSNAKLGTYLVAPNGMTLYHFTNDTPGVSTCTGQCAALWPAYTVSAALPPSAISGIGGAIGFIPHSQGNFQVTYNGSPLYFYYKDKNPGDTNGQNVGGVWFVTSP